MNIKLRNFFLILIIMLKAIACKDGKNPADDKETVKFSTPGKPAASDSIVNGLSIQKYPNGKKKMEGNYLNGKRTGLWMAWYENGILWSQGNYREGKRNGYSALYFPDGKIRTEGNYENDQKTGNWNFYNESGSLVKSINFSNPSDSLETKK